jgi:hypothetical protein
MITSAELSPGEPLGSVLTFESGDRRILIRGFAAMLGKLLLAGVVSALAITGASAADVDHDVVYDPLPYECRQETPWYYLCCASCDPADLAGLFGHRTKWECKEARRTMIALGHSVSECFHYSRSCVPNGTLPCYSQ